MGYRHVGTPRPLIEGRRKVTGRMTYTPDVHLPGMLHARFVLSPYAHARIRHIDVEDARQEPGVVAVVTAADLPPIPPTSRHWLLLARDRVIFVGHPVAVVLAESEQAAADGAERVLVDYEPLPAAMTMEEALAPDAPLVWPEGLPGRSEEAAAHGADVEGEETVRHGNIAQTVHFARGDISQGFAEADVVVEYTFRTPMVHQSFLEPHATVVAPDPVTGGARVWSSTQAPFYVRSEVATALGVPVSDVVVEPVAIGGGFGGKFLLYEPFVALLARHVGRPVSLVLTRMEELLAGNPAPAGRFWARLGAKQDGTLTALEAELTFDGGCFPSSPLGIAALLLGSYYRVPHLDIRGQEVLTFKPSSGAYRAPGAPQASFVIESLMDELARQLQMDPIELRLKNASRAGDPMANGKPWQPMGLRDVLLALRDHPAWQNREEARRQGRGVGIAVGGWPGGIEPSAAVCTLHPDGTLHVHITAVDLTGTHTGFAILAAEAFGTDPRNVRVVQANTDAGPYAGSAGGSKITYTVGPAVIEAARHAREQVLFIAAQEFGVAPQEVDIEGKEVYVRSELERRMSLGTLAAKTMRFGGEYPPILGYGRHADTTQSPGFSAQLAEVSVDRETGRVQVHRVVVVQDVGRAINPLLIRGQMMGAVVQGIGWALYEEMVYDSEGQLLTASWSDYVLPGAAEAPQIETVIVEVPTDHGPYGARGVGEPPVIPTAAAIANAVTDALGVRLTQLPMKPERVVRALGGLRVKERG